MNDHELATWLAQTAGQQLLELRAETLVPTGDDVAAKALEPETSVAAKMLAAPASDKALPNA
jgi:hypothetical protein